MVGWTAGVTRRNRRGRQLVLTAQGAAELVTSFQQVGAVALPQVSAVSIWIS